MIGTRTARSRSSSIPSPGAYVDPSSRPPPAPKTRGRGLRVIDDAAAPKKEAPQVRLLARPADAKPAAGTVIQKKEEKKKLAELPKDLSNADAETVKRLKAERAPERLLDNHARGASCTSTRTATSS